MLTIKTPATATAPRGALGLLLDRRFGAFFAARLLTSMGVWLHGVVAAIAAYEATGSAIIVGLVSAVQFTPQLILAPISGAWTDRGNIKLQMILGRGTVATGSLATAAWYGFSETTSDSTGAVVVIIASLVVGLGLVIGGPAMQSATPALVSSAELPAAMALNTAPITIGRIAGPAIGALTTAGAGYASAFLVAGIASLLFIPLTAWITFPAPAGRKDGERYSVREGLAFVRSDQPVLLTLIGITAVGFASEPIVTLAPPLAAEFGGDAATVGILTSSMGVGAAIGVVLTSICAARASHERTATAGILVMAFALTACAVPLPYYGAIAAFACAGLGFIISVSGLSTVLQIRLPPTMRGRVMALWLMGFVGSRPLGALTVGSLTDIISVQAGFGSVALVLLGTAAWCRPRRLREQASADLSDDIRNRYDDTCDR